MQYIKWTKLDIMEMQLPHLRCFKVVASLFIMKGKNDRFIFVRGVSGLCLYQFE